MWMGGFVPLGEGVDFARLKIEKFDGHSWEARPDAPYTGIWKDT
jgi:hypothetical protein